MIRNFCFYNIIILSLNNYIINNYIINNYIINNYIINNYIINLNNILSKFIILLLKDKIINL